MSQTFCPLPWMFQAVRNNGDIRLCCQANVSEGQGLVKDERGRVLNARDADFDKARNAPLMREARRQMLRGEWPQSCKRCREEESAGLRSRRLYENQNWGKEWTLARAEESTSTDGSIDTQKNPVESYDVRFGNKCNLKCRMCGPTDSDSWYDDYAALIGKSFVDSGKTVRLKKDHNDRWQASDDGYTWFESPKFWEHLERGIPHLKHLHIVGGEPLIIYSHYDFLEKIVKSGHAGQVTLEYNTNLTVLPERALELWAHFQSVRIGVSLDGVNEFHSYIRYPGKWSVIERNMRKLDQAQGNFELWISCTVQNLNILHIPDLIRWKLKSGLKAFSKSKKLPFITSHMLHSPPTLNVRSLPEELKAQVRARFADFKFWFDEEYLHKDFSGSREDGEHLRKRLHELLDGYLRYMEAEDWAHHFTEFVRFTRQLDERRGQSVTSLIPEFQPWF